MSELAASAGATPDFLSLGRYLPRMDSSGSSGEKTPRCREPGFVLVCSGVEKSHVVQHTSLNRAAADLVQFDKWDSAATERRQGMLARLAQKVWGAEKAKPEVAG